MWKRNHQTYTGTSFYYHIENNSRIAMPPSQNHRPSGPGKRNRKKAGKRPASQPVIGCLAHRYTPSPEQPRTREKCLISDLPLTKPSGIWVQSQSSHGSTEANERVSNNLTKINQVTIFKNQWHRKTIPSHTHARKGKQNKHRHTPPETQEKEARGWGKVQSKAFLSINVLK